MFTVFSHWNVIWPLIVNPGCVGLDVLGCAWSFLLELCMWSWGMEQSNTHLHMHAQRRRINMTQRSSMRVAGRGTCFSALPAHTHTQDTPYLSLERGVFSIWGQGVWVRCSVESTSASKAAEGESLASVIFCCALVLGRRGSNCYPCVSWRKWWSFCTRKVFYSTVRGEESRVQMTARWVRVSFKYLFWAVVLFWNMQPGPENVCN